MSACHYSDNETKSNSENNNQPPRQFTGTFAPSVLHDLVEEGKIPASAAWLAMTIHAYSKGKLGCFASNEYLGKKIHKGPRQVQRLLEYLEKTEILESEWRDDGKRYLTIDCNKKSKTKRKEEYFKYVKNDISDDCVNSDISTTSELSFQDTSDLTDIIDNRINNRIEEKKRSSDISENSLGINQEARQFAIELMERCRQEDRLPTSMKLANSKQTEKQLDEWSSGIKRLLRGLRQEFEKYFPIYLDNLGKKHWPECFNGKSIFDKWDQIVNACHRLEQDKVSSNNGHHDKPRKVAVHINRLNNRSTGNILTVEEAGKLTGGEWYDDAGRNVYVLPGGNIPRDSKRYDFLPNPPEDN